MYRMAVFPGKYIQGAGAVGEVPALIELFGRQGMLLASPTVLDWVLPRQRMDFSEQGVAIERFAGECTLGEIERIVSSAQDKGVDVLVGMGGGKVIDTAKVVADRAEIPVIIAPTVASTDAPCSACAILYSNDGIFRSVYYQKTNPAAVVADTTILASAPPRYLIAGMGDALATWFEARSCERTQSPNECGGVSTLSAMNLAKLCYDTLIADGAAARLACERELVTPALERVIEANILLSGVGFESSGLAAAHAIHNGLTALPETHGFLHGEKVAFGVLAGLQLTGAPASEMEEALAFCEAIGLPMTLAEIGLGEAAAEQLMTAARKTCEPGSSIHHEAGAMEAERVLDAILAADALGQLRKPAQPEPEPEIEDEEEAEQEVVESRIEEARSRTFKEEVKTLDMHGGR